MQSIGFPRMFNSTTTLVKSDYNMTLQNLMSLLHCEKMELFGDPYFGVNLKKYLFDQNDVILKDILIDDIFQQLKLFMPQLKMNRTDINIVQNGTELTCEIKAVNQADFTTNMYSIVLLSEEEA